MEAKPDVSVSNELGIEQREVEVNSNLLFLPAGFVKPLHVVMTWPTSQACMRHFILDKR